MNKLGLLLLLFVFTSSSAQLEVQIRLGDRMACDNASLVFLDSVVVGKPTTYEWISTVATFTSAATSITEATFSGSGEVILKTTNGMDIFYDTVNVILNTAPIASIASSDELCCGDAVYSLSDQVISPVWNDRTGRFFTPGYSNLVVGEDFFADSLCQNSNFSLLGYEHVDVVYRYTDTSNGCSDDDTLQIRVSQKSTLILDRRIFCNNGGLVDPLDDIVLVPGNTSTGNTQWKCLECNGNNEDSIVLKTGPSFAPRWRFDFEGYVFKNTAVDTLLFEFTYENTLGCTSIDTVELELWKSPELVFGTSRELCYDEGVVSLGSVFSPNMPGGSWTCLDSTGYRPCSELGDITNGAINTRSSVELASSSTLPNAFYIEYVELASGCITTIDTALVINPRPNITLNPLRPTANFCNTEDAISLSGTPVGGVWTSSIAGTVVGNIFDPSKVQVDNSTAKLYYSFTDPSTGCANTDSIEALVRLSPVIFSPTDTFFCFDSLQNSIVELYELKALNSDNVQAIAANTFGNSTDFSMNYDGDSVLRVVYSNFEDAELFRIGINAVGRGPCPSVNDFFDVEAVTDTRCLLSVHTPKAEPVSIYPNPTRGWVTINVSGAYEVVVKDVLGKRTPTQQEGSRIYLPQEGIYFIGVISNNGKTVSWTRVLVQ